MNAILSLNDENDDCQEQEERSNRTTDNANQLLLGDCLLSDILFKKNSCFYVCGRQVVNNIREESVSINIG